MAVYASNPAGKGPFAGNNAPGVVAHAIPAGTFMPGTKVQVGTHRVVIDRYLSEGGFAHVYVVQLPRPVDGNEKAVLKRVAVPDKDHLANMRNEVETMKRLRGQKVIVKYIDSHASQLKGGGYEVFLLMEYCQGGGLIDFMNTRLQNRLTEPEILKIFTDVAEGVACMHYLKPPLLHRDLKIENVLISKSGSTRLYKLCDFGSAAPPRPAATTAAEGRLIEDDVQRHTTLQYRSPEMVDVYRKQPIDEKSDIWALGVFLYKLCYYTTPFEEAGQMAILNAKFKYPGYPRFSDQMKLLIASMLREKPGDRPNIYQVLQKACHLDGRELTLHDIYAHRSKSESRKDQVLPQSPTSQAKSGATLVPPTQSSAALSVPDVAPMRRGRPTKPVSHHNSAHPSPSPLRMVDQSDQAAAFDGHKGDLGDDFSSRFPSLDQFSLMTDRSKNFAFASQAESYPESKDPVLAKRVTEALADDAFTKPTMPVKSMTAPARPAVAPKPQNGPTPDETTARVGHKPHISTSTAAQAKNAMISTGTMTSPVTSALPPTKPISEKPIWKVPTSESSQRSTSTGASTSITRVAAGASKSGSRLANLLREDALNSQGVPEQEKERASPTSSRPSLEGARPTMKAMEEGLNRSRSLNSRNRPASVNIGKGPTHINDRGIRKASYEANFVSAEPEMPELAQIESETHISSDIDFLKAREEEERERHKHQKRLSSSGSRHNKRSSLPHIAMQGTKNILTGRFGDAFKKFEGGHGSPERERSLSPARQRAGAMSPIASSEATEPRDDGDILDETEDLSPEMRRELEKRKLEAEEKRVAAAAAEYRQRVAGKAGGATGEGGVSGRAANIQNKVQSLLKENDRPSPKTAAGYGRYTGETESSQGQRLEKPSSYQPGPHVTSQATQRTTTVDPKSFSAPTSANNNLATQEGRSQRPMAPPKPQVLRKQMDDIDSVADNANGASNMSDDWETNFNKRYPSLSGLEIVETDIESGKKSPVKLREV